MAKGIVSIMHSRSAKAQKNLGLCLPAIMLALACQPAIAQAPEPPSQQKPTPVVSTLTLDVNNDGVADRVDLVFDGETDVDLNIYLGRKGESEFDAAPSFTKKAIAYHGNSPGQNASLEAGAKGSFIILSLNESVPRDRWEKKLTITFRNKDFVVAALNYTESDTQDPNEGGTCDVNFVTGRSVKDGKAIADKVELIPLKDWEPDFLPPACEF